MSTATMGIGGEAAVTPAELGWKFIHWGWACLSLDLLLRPDPALHGRRSGRRCGPSVSKKHHVVVGFPGDPG